MFLGFFSHHLTSILCLVLGERRLHYFKRINMLIGLAYEVLNQAGKIACHETIYNLNVYFPLFFSLVSL